jgi:hypothetical protein
MRADWEESRSRSREEPPQFLAGWKDIANYLGKGVRSVQRYEHELGLPVRRPAGKPRGSVVATKAEIDAWVAASPIREAFYLPRTPSKSAETIWASIQQGKEEMQRLREQMQALRADLRSTVTMLHTSVQGLRGKVRAVGSPIDEYVSNVDEAFDLLSIDMGGRKAS